MSSGRRNQSGRRSDATKYETIDKMKRATQRADTERFYRGLLSLSQAKQMAKEDEFFLFYLTSPVDDEPRLDLQLHFCCKDEGMEVRVHPVRQNEVAHWFVDYGDIHPPSFANLGALAEFYTIYRCMLGETSMSILPAETQCLLLSDIDQGYDELA